MSNYSKTTNFAAKDALASGNPLKTIKGTEFNVEFDALQVASATKANIAAPTFTGVPAAPTANAGTNTTQIATTAFANAAATAAGAASMPKSGGAFTGAVTTNSTFDGRDVAADGILATNAMPKSGGAFSGAVTTNSTIDGRDVAADGVLATNAMPKSGGAFSGALTTNSTFDGRNVSTDGSKLDGVATNANNFSYPSQSGKTGKFLKTNGSAALWDDVPEGGNVVDFVASGTLPNGKPVILKANGQVEVVKITTAAVSPNIPAGTAVAAPNASTAVVDTEIAFDPNTSGKFVISYHIAGNRPLLAYIGTLSGTSLSFGSPVQYSIGNSDNGNVKYNPNVANQFITAFTDGGNNNYGKARIGSVNGTSISYATAVAFNSGQTLYISLSVDTNTSGKFVVVYRDGATSNLGMSIVGTINGTAISISSESVFEGSATTYAKVAYDISTANKYLVTSTASDGNTYARVGTISGSSTSYGTRTQILDYSLNDHYDMKSNPNVAGQFLIITQNSSIGKAYILTVSGTGVSIGDAYTFSSDVTPNDMRVAFDPNTSGAFAITYRGTSSYQWIISGNIVGSNIIFQAKDAVTSAYSNNLAIEFDPNTALKFVTASTESNNSFKGKAVVGTIGKSPVYNLTSTNFLGTSTAAYTNGQTATIMLQGGVSTNQSSLAIGSTYYVQIDGTLATSADSTSGAPSVIAGKAVKATTLLLKGV